MESRKKNAMVLSGGGVFGAYEVGVLLALARGLSAGSDYRPLEPSIFTGTSAGAFNAAFLTSMAGPPAETTTELARVWCERIADQGDGNGNGVFRFRANPFEFLNPWIVSRHPLRSLEQLTEDTAFLTRQGLGRAWHFFTGRRRPLSERLVEFFDFAVVVSTKPMLRTIRETIDFAGLRRSTHLLQVAATDWETGRLKLFDNRDMSDEWGPELIRGSASIPGIFPPQPIGTWQLVDGGVVMNAPLTPAIDAGAQVLHVIQVTPELSTVPLAPYPSTMGSMIRAQLSTWASAVDDAIQNIVEINHSLEMRALVHRQLEKSLVPADELSWFDKLVARMASVADVAEWTNVTIHRYKPRRFFRGYGGPLSVLEFNRTNIEELMAQGYRDAIAHDCALDGCILPVHPTTVAPAAHQTTDAGHSGFTQGRQSPPEPLPVFRE